jgi:Rieske Fe-S protein
VRAQDFFGLHDRRDFIRTFVVLGASSLVADRPWAATLIGEPTASPTPPTAILQIKLGDFPSLQKDYGSVRIGTSPVNGQQFPSGLFYPVLVNRAPGDRFYALDAECTHAGCTVPVLNSAAKYSQCPCHGSRFAIDGQVLRSPANSPLRQFAIVFDGRDTLTIDLPAAEIQGMDGFSLAVSKIETPPGRVELKFLSYQGIQYEIKARSPLSTGWETVPFALDRSGPLDRTTFDGTDDFATVFAAAPAGSGFYAVAMKTRAV